MVARIGQAFTHLRSNSDYEMRLQSFSLPPQYAKTNSSDVLVHTNSKVYTMLPGYYDVRCSPLGMVSLKERQNYPACNHYVQ